MDKPYQLKARFDLSGREKNTVRDAAAELGVPNEFPAILTAAIEGSGSETTALVWFWARDNGVDVDLETVHDWRPGTDYELVMPTGDESEGEEPAAENGGSTTSTSSSPSSSSTKASPEKKSSTGTQTSSPQPSTT